MPTESEPLRLRLLNDYEVVVAGLRAMIEPFSDRVAVVEEDVQSSADRPVDITLYDTFGAVQADREDIDEVVSDPLSGAVVVYSWNGQPALVRAALERGCRGYLAKGLPAAEIVSALERVGAGETVVERVDEGQAAKDLEAEADKDQAAEADEAAEDRAAEADEADEGQDQDRPRDPVGGDWPGRPAGLSVREAEVIALITQGLTNSEIASRAYISMNSLKSYIRTGYRKIGVERRSQAVRWGMENGMLR